MDECFSKLEEKFPGCLNDKDFAKLFVRYGSNLLGDVRPTTTYYDRFSGEGKIGLIESFDF